MCLQKATGDLDLPGDVVELPPKAVELVRQFGAQGAVVAANPPVPARGVRLDHAPVGGGAHAGAGHPAQHSIQAGAFKIGVLLYAQVGEPFQLLAEPPLVGARRNVQHGRDRPGLVGTHRPVRDSGYQRDVATEVVVVDPGSYRWEVLCGNQQVAGQGPDDRQDGPLPPAVLGRDVQQFPDVLEAPERDPGTVGDKLAALVRLVGDVAGLLRYSLEFCL